MGQVHDNEKLLHARKWPLIKKKKKKKKPCPDTVLNLTMEYLSHIVAHYRLT